MLRLLGRDRSSPANDLPNHDFPMSSGNTNKDVVVVMDGMTEFTTEPLQWTLDNVVTTGCIVTLLGVMPWLNIPLFLKTKNDFWTVDLEDAPLGNDKSECGHGVKCLKRHAVIDLCRKYGVVPHKKTVMGYPLRLLIVEEIMTLYPTWVVFDRSHRRNKEFYARKIPCNILMMNDDGTVDMVRSRLMTESPLSSASTPQLTVSEESEEAIKERDHMDDKNCGGCSSCSSTRNF